MAKTIREIRNELLFAFLELEESYFNVPTTTDPEKRIQYLEIDMCESLLNSLKAMEYHYRDDVSGMRTKKNWNNELIKANKLIDKYADPDTTSISSKSIKLDKKFDTSGYLEHREFFTDAADNREKLKRTRTS